MTSQSLGIDMETIERFKRLKRRKHGLFLRRIYTERELAYCYAVREPWRRLASRFAAKEAVFKALSCLGFRCSDFKMIEIGKGAKGMPQVFLRGNIRNKAKVLVSLSRSGKHALALAAAEALS